MTCLLSPPRALFESTAMKELSTIPSSADTIPFSALAFLARESAVVRERSLKFRALHH
jgi:hypothetical protein